MVEQGMPIKINKNKKTFLFSYLEKSENMVEEVKQITVKTDNYEKLFKDVKAIVFKDYSAAMNFLISAKLQQFIFTTDKNSVTIELN